jgi:hypothetical protein
MENPIGSEKNNPRRYLRMLQKKKKELKKRSKPEITPLNLG